MKSIQFKSIFPHLIAVAIFLLVTVIFCKPALESGVTLKQGDVTSWQGMSHQSMEYKEAHGHFPLWVTNMFGGMPGYQIAMEGDWSPLSIFDKVIQLGLPQPFNFFYLACICFYFLCICLGLSPFAAIIGALAFAFSSYSPIIITAGHNTKMLALAYAPAVMGAAVLVFNKKYWIGAGLLALFTALQIAQGHQQITYYLLLVLGAMGVAYVVYFIKSKELKHLIQSIGILIFAGILGVATNALSLMTAYDFSKDSKRGGQLVMNNKSSEKDAVVNGKTVGLSKDYAFMWSYGKAETWSLMFPGVKGYGTHQAQRNGEVYVFPELKENSHLVEYVNENVPGIPTDQIASQLSSALYWGDQPFTNGPVYLGAIICFLFIFGMFYLDNKHKWWIFSICVLSILLSWGENFPAFNYFMFDHFPLYNKFRVPTMILVIPQLLFPLMGALVLNKISEASTTDTMKAFKLASIGTAAAFALITIFYLSSDFSKENKERTAAFNAIIQTQNGNMNEKINQLNDKYKPNVDNQIYEGMYSNFAQGQVPEPQKKAREFLSALRQDRAALLLSDIFRALILVSISALMIYLFVAKKINAIIMIVGVSLLSTIDLLEFGSHYLNEKSFDLKEDYEASEFPISDADRVIMNDKDPNFRVMNTSGLEESKTSYYHKSIGGYHPAKLGIYDDLMSYQLSGSPNLNVINMLNTKYFIQQQGDNKIASQNENALGNVWLVDSIRFVNGPVAEMTALNNFNPADVAVVDESFKNKITAFQPKDSLSSIRQVNFDNDAITYQSQSTKNQLAVFSEIYYKDWKAYIDGKPADFVKANYVLRAMVVPAGTHQISFKFEPAVFYKGKQISNIASWLVLVLLIAAIALYILNQKKKQTSKTVA